MLRPGHFSGLNSGDVENNHVFVEVVEVPRVALVPVVGELGGLVPVGVDAAVVTIDTQGFMIEDGAENTAGLDSVALRGQNFDGTGAVKVEVDAGALPEGNCLGIDELGVLVVERAGLEEHVGGGTELGQHHDVLKVLRGETLHASHVEKGGHAGQTVNGKCHLVGGVSDEIRIEDRLDRGELLGILSIVASQEVDAPCISGASVRTGVVHVVESFRDHVVDGTHDEVVERNGHPLLDLVQKHRQETVELSGAGEGLIQALLLHRALDLERGHLVEELDVHVRLVEHVGIVGSTVGQVPALVLGGSGKPGADLLQNGAVPPVIHQNGGGAAGIGTIHKDNLTNVIDKGANETIERIGVEDGVACIDNASEVLGDEVILAENLGQRLVDDLINLFYFHCCSPFVLVD